VLHCLSAQRATVQLSILLQPYHLMRLGIPRDAGGTDPWPQTKYTPLHNLQHILHTRKRW
jgi:hypothetical protein